MRPATSDLPRREPGKLSVGSRQGKAEHSRHKESSRMAIQDSRSHLVVASPAKPLLAG